ncbi:MAG: hypothetical protein F4226_06485 [Synechococcus sp. SB0678_bin_12]|nr:hypothetical protein [Synechococcus sp. SB0678_bin_12]MYI87430.1 hypothetical protein [Synechococcus sp. SB0672_bin_10]
MTTTTLLSRQCYTGTHGSASWCGKAVDDRRRFAAFLRDVVGRRVADEESVFAADLRGLATTDMAAEQVERLLQAVPDPKSSEIGEGVGGVCADEHLPRCSALDSQSPGSLRFFPNPPEAPEDVT